MSRALAAAVAVFWAGAARGGPPVVPPPSPAWITISTEELRAGYDTLWAVSDVHGQRKSLQKLLLAAGLVERDGREVRWMPGRGRQLLVVVGDCIDGGPDSVGVVTLLNALQAQAASAGSRVVVLLGNHEVDFFAWRPPENDFSRFLRTMPAAAFIGSWLFAHAGYIDAEDDDAALSDWFARIAASWPLGDGERYRPLRDSRSIVSYHRWWESPRRRSRMKAHLTRLGLDGLVFGHDPGAFGAPGTIAMEAGGWLIKLDTGMKTGSRGMLLRCEVQRLATATGLAMREEGKPTCGGLTPDGKLHHLPVE